jgi:hypothetical protein
MRFRAVLAVVCVLLMSLAAGASSPVGIYGIVEKVVFEPGEANAERIQVWGAFAFVDGGASGGSLDVSQAMRGYLYFTLSSRATPTAIAGGLPLNTSPDVSDSDLASVRREWTDLKAVAGTGQAVGFGEWRYAGGYRRFMTSRPELAVRAVSARPADPGVYRTNAGIVKLTEASHAPVIRLLRNALRK